MKKLFLLILILPFASWAQVDSLSIDEMIANSPSCLVIQSRKNKDLEIAKINSLKDKKIYVLNGVYVDSEEIKNLSPDNIESVHLLKNNAIGCRMTDKDVIVIVTRDTNINPEEYDLSVLDLGYESFLKMQPSAGNYSLSHLQNRNQHYVSIWNQRVLTGDPKIYEMSIDYDSNNYYGLELEHKLYMFFKFMEMKHSISMM